MANVTWPHAWLTPHGAAQPHMRRVSSARIVLTNAEAVGCMLVKASTPAVRSSQRFSALPENVALPEYRFTVVGEIVPVLAVLFGHRKKVPGLGVDWLEGDCGSTTHGTRRVVKRSLARL